MLYDKGYILGNSLSKIYVPSKEKLRLIQKNKKPSRWEWGK